jgi:hypothetical protein
MGAEILNATILMQQALRRFLFAEMQAVANP